jgi:hypothetical protein
VSSENRLKQLRQLLSRLERMPESPETERMLREVRARVVDVETGEKPRAMLPADSAASFAAAPEPRPAPRPKPVASPRPARPAPQRQATPAPVPASVSAAQDREWLALMAKNEVLSLDDSGQLSPAGEERSKTDRHPWRRGLRG